MVEDTEVLIDYSVVNKISIDNNSKYDIISEMNFDFGRTFERSTDDFFGQSLIKKGDIISGRSVDVIAVLKNGETAELLLRDESGYKVYSFRVNISPFQSPDNEFFSDKFWESPGIIKKRASKEEVQSDRDYALKNITSVAFDEKDIKEMYSQGDEDVREFIMFRIGDKELSRAESIGERVFPRGYDESWMRNRFLQTSGFLTEVFAFPDDLIREVFLSAFLTKGGSCLLSGVPGTGKSVAPFEPVMVRINGITKEYPIGDFIDMFMEKYSDGTDVYIFDRTDKIEVLTLDHNNKIVWADLKAVSRHKHNGDMFEVKTVSGRKILATGDHSFLTQTNGDIQIKKGSDLAKKDVVPSVKKWSTDHYSIVPVEEFMPKKDFIYGCEVKKALFKELDYTLPITEPSINNYKNGSRDIPKSDHVYTHYHNGMSIPQHINLDFDMGVLIGSYMAEGNVDRKTVYINNGNDFFLDRVTKSAQNKGLSATKGKKRRGNIRLSIFNDAFAEFINRSCNTGSHMKKIPDFSYYAPSEFVRGLLRSYFDGDGHVEKKEKSVCATTKSEYLAHGISVLLSRFGIPSCIKEKIIKSGKYKDNVYFTVKINSKFVERFNSKIGFGLDYKRNRSEKISGKYNSTDMLTNFGDLLEKCAKDCSLKTASRVDGEIIQIGRSTKRQRIGRTLAKRYYEMFNKINPDSEHVAKLGNLVNSDVIWDAISSIEKIPYDGYVYDFEVDSVTNSFVAGRGMMVVHNTTAVDIATLLFCNGYGFADFEYRAPIQDLMSGKIPAAIYKDMNHRGDADNTENILTIQPTDEQLKDKTRKWVILDNIEMTNKTTIVINKTSERNINEFIKSIRHKLTKNETDQLKDFLTKNSESIKIGSYEGYLYSQKYSRNRVGELLSEWEENRFDSELLLEDYGVLKNKYYTKSLLREGKMGTQIINSKKQKIPSQYVSDVTYDMAKYPDTDTLVKWKEEIADEIKFLNKEDELNKIREDLRSRIPSSDIEKRDEAKQKEQNIMDMRCRIHKMAELPQIKWESEYGRGIKGKLSDAELKHINERYYELYEDLKYLIHTIRDTKEKINIFNARSNDEILEEMKMDMGIATCSENKTPEDILYTTEISLVQDTDSIGRPVEQYVFKPTPLDFVTKAAKFLNEFSRADKDFQDQLLSLLDRGIVEHRGKRFKSPRFILFADNNPHKLLTAQIDWALWDRLDIELMLKGASLGVKDMVLTRKFGREDILMGRTKIKMNAEEELLDRISKAAISLNRFKTSADFRDTGMINKISEDDAQPVVPLRIRDIQKMWEYVDNISIPRNVLHLAFLLTTTMNQAWYIKKTKINETTDVGKMIQLAGTEMIKTNFDPYGPDVKPRHAIVDYSMLSFANDFMKSSTEISNIEEDRAENQFPLGVTRPVGIRFVISLLKFAKSLAWLRRGKTEVTEKEIYDLFPLVGSHRLNIMPFGEERVAGVDESIKQLYPNIQDFLKYGILDNYWKPRSEQYLNYYDDLESIVNAGYLNVDGCPPPEISTRANSLCKIKGSYDTHSALATHWDKDVMILDIQNGVEFAKRNSPDYKIHYTHRLEEIMNIGNKNYYEDFIDKAKQRIDNYDLNQKSPGNYKVPMLLFPIDADELKNRLDALTNIFDVEYHKLLLNSPMIIDNVAIPVLKGFKDYIEPGNSVELENIIKNFEGIVSIYDMIRFVDLADDPMTVPGLESLLRSFNKKLPSPPDKDKIMEILNKQLQSISINEKYPLKYAGYKVGKSKIHGELSVVFDLNKNERFIKMVATTKREHLLWRYIRFNEPFEEPDMLTANDQLS